FDRVVVDEDQTVDSDVEAGRDGLEGFRFVVPVGQESRDVGAAKEHFRVLAKCSLRDLRVILGADGQNNATLLELLGLPLQGQMCLAGRASLSNNDTLQPVVSDHAAPQGVIEIEHEALLRYPTLGGKDPSDKIAIEWRCLRGDFQFALKPAP